MKKLNFLLIAFLALSISSLVFTSCEDDENEPDKVYVGEWESAIYPDIDLSTGLPKGTQKMVFEFTNTSFVGTIYAGLIDATTDAELQEATAMKGSISATDTQKLNDSIGLFFDTDGDGQLTQPEDAKIVKFENVRQPTERER